MQHLYVHVRIQSSLVPLFKGSSNQTSNQVLASVCPIASVGNGGKCTSRTNLYASRIVKLDLQKCMQLARGVILLCRLRLRRGHIWAQGLIKMQSRAFCYMLQDPGFQNGGGKFSLQ